MSGDERKGILIAVAFCAGFWLLVTAAFAAFT